MKALYFYLFAGVLIIIILILFILRFFAPNSPTQKQVQTFPTPTLVLRSTQTSLPEQSASENYNISAQEKQKINQAYFVSSLVNNVPYRGQDFTLAYNFDTATFLLTLDKNNLTAANAEFNAYLKTNGIKDKSWFDNLVTNYK